MTQLEIKEWIEWFVEAINEASIFKGKLLVYYQYHSAQIRDFAYHPIGGHIYLEGELQLVLQEEIAKQGWSWQLNVNPKLKPQLILNTTSNTQNFKFENCINQTADTILECFMYAFKQAWELTK